MAHTVRSNGWLPLAVVLEAWNGQLTMIEAVFAEMTPVTSGVGMQSIFDGSACQNSNDPVHAACIDSQQEKAAKGLILQPAYAAYMSTLSMDELLQAAAAETVVESAPGGKEVSDAPGGKEVSDAPGGKAVESAVASGTQTSEKPLIDQLAGLSIAPKFHPQVEALMTFTPEFKLVENDQVQMTDTNPLCITVRNHDGKSDDVGEEIKFDKIDISGMPEMSILSNLISSPTSSLLPSWLRTVIQRGFVSVICTWSFSTSLNSGVNVMRASTCG